MTTKLYTAGESFTFSSENKEKIKKILAQYPKGREMSATLPLLDLAQRQNQGWLSREALEGVAETLSLPFMHVYEVASFYTMFNLQPVGKFLVQVCTTTPCWLRGSDSILKTCQAYAKRTEAEQGQNLFTVMEVECLGACANAPMVQINDDYYEDLTPQGTEKILKQLENDEAPKVGSLIGRRSSEPVDMASIKNDIQEES